jgi:hypothetical protein
LGEFWLFLKITRHVSALAQYSPKSVAAPFSTNYQGNIWLCWHAICCFTIIGDDSSFPAIGRNSKLSRRRCAMSITMSMSSYEIEHDSMEAEYGAEIMCAGWNPAVDLVCQQQLLTTIEKQMAMPTDLTAVIAELFLRKMYSYQR